MRLHPAIILAVIGAVALVVAGALYGRSLLTLAFGAVGVCLLMAALVVALLVRNRP